MCCCFFSAMTSAIKKKTCEFPSFGNCGPPQSGQCSWQARNITNMSNSHECCCLNKKSSEKTSVQVAVSGIFLPLYAIVLTWPRTNWLCWWWKWHLFTTQKCHKSAKLHEIEGWFHTSQDSTVGQWINWIIYRYVSINIFLYHEHHAI